MAQSKLWHIRHKDNISAKYLADCIGREYQTYLLKERGKVSWSLEDIAIITSVLGLSQDDIIDIFFDGDLPVRDDLDGPSTDYSAFLLPLKSARRNAGYTEAQVAEMMGTSALSYRRKEDGLKCNVKDVRALTAIFNLSFDEVNTIFFRGLLTHPDVRKAS